MNKKVTYLPHVKERLQEQFTQMHRLINEGDANAALAVIENLLKHEYKVEQLYVKKLYCLSELKRWREVEQLVVSLRQKKLKPHYDLYYLLSLYKQEHYSLVIDFYKESIDAAQMPENIYKEIKYLYDESKHMINNEARKIHKQLQLAIVSGNEQEQWHLFHQWDKLCIAPPELFLFMLQEERVNPFVKTYLLQALADWQVADVVTVEKFGKAKTFKLVKLKDLSHFTNDPIYLQTLKQIESVEQNNPTLYDLVVELLQRYVEYTYPFMYKSEDVPYMSEAVIALARDYLEGDDVNKQKLESKTIDYIELIQKSNEAYFHLIMT